MRILLLSLLAAASLAAALPAAAQTKSFRCRNDLVNLGDDKASALLKCGEPMLRDNFCNPLATVTTVPPARPWLDNRSTTVLNVGRCDPVDEWTYNPGYGQFITTLRFESGRLTEIRYGDRVK
jgi:hypothetical protein